MNTENKIDLSTCVQGQPLKRRDGHILLFQGPSKAEIYPFLARDVNGTLWSYTKDGAYRTDDSDSFDIIEIFPIEADAENLKQRVAAWEKANAELASLQRSYEVERHCSGERMAQILELKREVEKMTAERDRLKPRPINQPPTLADTDHHGRVLLIGPGGVSTLALAQNWDVHKSWTNWLPCNLESYGMYTKEDEERERFEKAFYSTFPNDPPLEKKEEFYRIWQAARKENA